MYSPYITTRFGGSGHLAPRKRVQAAFDKGELLLVKRKGESIAGQLIFYEGSTACMAWIGVRNGKWEYVRDGAQLALYEFSFRRAEEKGCSKMDLTRCRPFLNDGVLRIKRKWSQRIFGAVKNKFLMQIVSDCDATRAFLENMPFIFERFGELLGAVFVNGESSLTLEALQKISNRFNKPHRYIPVPATVSCRLGTLDPRVSLHRNSPGHRHLSPRRKSKGAFADGG
jgi:hypothetical protein